MPVQRSRRGFIATLVSVGSAACIGGGPDESGDASSDDSSSSSDDDTTPDDSESGETDADQEGTESGGGDDEEAESDDADAGSDDDELTPEEQVARLPEPNPLGDVFVDLILADDRKRFAEEHDLAFRDGTVQVEIRLVEGGDPPAAYLPEDRSEYGNTVIAYVAVDDLVDLALDDDVRRVFRRFDPEPDPGGS